MSMNTHLQQLKKIKRTTYHPLIHTIHKKYKISKQTLFYVKEYGSRSNATHTIIRESIKILVLSALISAFGGLAIDQVKTVFFALAPLIIMLPMLNDMIGDFSTIVSARFATMLHEGKVKTKWWKQPELKKLFFQILIVGAITAAASTLTSFWISSLLGHITDNQAIYKIFFVVILDIVLLVTLIFLATIILGLYFYNKKEDPNNFLIPITTSIADFGNMLLLSVLVILIF